MSYFTSSCVIVVSSLLSFGGVCRIFQLSKRLYIQSQFSPKSFSQFIPSFSPNSSPHFFLKSFHIILLFSFYSLPSYLIICFLMSYILPHHLLFTLYLRHLYQPIKLKSKLFFNFLFLLIPPNKPGIRNRYYLRI